MAAGSAFQTLISSPGKRIVERMEIRLKDL